MNVYVSRMTHPHRSPVCWRQSPACGGWPGAAGRLSMLPDYLLEDIGMLRPYIRMVLRMGRPDG